MITECVLQFVQVYPRFGNHVLHLIEVHFIDVLTLQDFVHLVQVFLDLCELLGVGTGGTGLFDDSCLVQQSESFILQLLNDQVPIFKALSASFAVWRNTGKASSTSVTTRTRNARNTTTVTILFVTLHVNRAREITITLCNAKQK